MTSRLALAAFAAAVLSFTTPARAITPSTQTPTLGNQNPTVDRLARGMSPAQLAANRTALKRAAVDDQARAVVASDRGRVAAATKDIAQLRAGIRAAKTESARLPNPRSVDDARRRGEATPLRTLSVPQRGTGKPVGPADATVVLGGAPVGPIDAKYLAFTGRHATPADVGWLNSRVRTEIRTLQKDRDDARGDLKRDRASLTRADRELRATKLQRPTTTSAPP